jgi:hypothetical protein
MPETYVFRRVMERIETAAARLAAGLQLPLSRQAEVIEVTRSVGMTSRDPHLLFAQIGERLGLLSEIIVRGAFLGVWADEYPDQVEAVLSPIHDLLPFEG